MTMRLLILWDGDCGFCARSLDWVKRQKIEGEFLYLSFHDAAAAQWREKIGVGKLEKAMHVVDEEGKISAGADGFRVMLSQMPRWKWLAAIMALPGIRHLCRAGYRWVAANRSRLGKHSCKLKQ